MLSKKSGRHSLQIFALCLLAACQPPVPAEPDPADAGPSSAPRDVARPTSSLQNPPNILLITLDTTRADKLGAYGNSGDLTPTLDRLATAGTTFEQAYSPCPMTLPTHATMLTGLAPPEHGVHLNGKSRLGDAPHTLAQVLATHGYSTGAFVAAFVLDEKFGLGRGFEVYDDDLSEAYDQEVVESLSRYRSGAKVTDAALAWLETAEATRDESGLRKPFFAWVHLYDPHFPYQAHPELAGTPFEDEANYDAELVFTDRQVARLLDFLEQHDLRENTLVVAVADHGEALGDHGDIDHGHFLYEEILRVPLLISWPEHVQANHRVSALVSLKDLFPTVLDLVGIEAPAQGRGRSLREGLEGKILESMPVYAETELPRANFGWSPQQGLVTPQWKYIRTPLPEVFDRENDPGEMFNLASARPDRLEILENELAGLEAAMAKTDAPHVELDPADRLRLEALGYVLPGSGSAQAASDAPEALGLRDMKTMLPVKQLAAKFRSATDKNLGSPDELHAMALELVERSPETASFQRELGWLQLKRGDTDTAIQTLRIALRLEPDAAGSHLGLAEALSARNASDPEVEKHFRQALELEPAMAAAHLGLGNVLGARGQRDLAAGHYAEAIRLRPEMAQAHYNLASNLALRGKPDLAAKSFRRAVELRPQWAAAHFDLANMLRRLGQSKEALKHYEINLELAPSAEAHNNLGVMLIESDRTDEGLSHYRAAIELDSEFHRPHVNLGNFLAQQERWTEALEHYEEAVRLRPDSPAATRQLAWLLATCDDQSLRDASRAVQLAERAHELNPHTSALILHTLATAYAESGEIGLARETADRAEKIAELRGNRQLAQEIRESRALYGSPTDGADPPPAPAPPANEAPEKVSQGALPM